MKNKECTCTRLVTESEIKIINQCNNCYEREIKKLKLLKSILETSFNILNSFKKQHVTNYSKETNENQK